MSNEPRRYISYLLRLWQTENEEGLVWRASLESPHSGERSGFTSLASLLAYLEREMSGIERQEASPPDDADP